MPNRTAEKQKAPKRIRGMSQENPKRSSRKINFENEPWYAAAAQRMSAARPTDRQLAQVSSPPLASE
jgi:hypothetical protein